jgi:hypothetical protein
MTSSIYGIKYLLNKIIPLKRLGKQIALKILLSYTPDYCKNGLESRLSLIKAITGMFELCNDTITQLKERVLADLIDFKLDTHSVESHFNNFIERRKVMEENFKLLKQKREKMFLRDIQDAMIL